MEALLGSFSYLYNGLIQQNPSNAISKNEQTDITRIFQMSNCMGDARDLLRRSHPKTSKSEVEV